MIPQIFIKNILFVFCCLLCIDKNTSAQVLPEASVKMPHLPYAMNALAPAISEETMNFHYGKHLKNYIDNVNKLIVGTPFEGCDLQTIVKYSAGPIYNNGAQALNHIIYFNTFSPEAVHEPSGVLLDAIVQRWGSFGNFKREFTEAAVSLFGSGWAWLVQGNDGELYILQESNGSNPLSKGYTPLLGFDVWEHAYYLDYKNQRAEHIEKLWDIVDWDTVGARYTP